MHTSRKWQPTPAFLPGKSHGQRSLVGYSPGGHKESDTTEWLCMQYTPQIAYVLVIYTLSCPSSSHLIDTKKMPSPSGSCLWVEVLKKFVFSTQSWGIPFPHWLVNCDSASLAPQPCRTLVPPFSHIRLFPSFPAPPHRPPTTTTRELGETHRTFHKLILLNYHQCTLLL